jgi:hypothetical protein
MTFKRLVVPLALFASLILVPGASGQDVGGGAAAPGPTNTTTTTAPAVPEAEAAGQEDQPTTPEGEEQPPAEQPDGEQTPTEENGEETGPVAELPEDGAGGGGTLPETGLELVALTSIGLGLLLAGAALWPTSSWPPPRDRRSRSTTRRSAVRPPRPPQARPRTR